MSWFGESSSATLLQTGNCVCCGRDLANLQPGARFCPDCGSRLPLPPRRHFALVRAMLPLIHFGRGNVTNTHSGPGRTAVLMGYANALYQLGWRYERGSGTPRNLPEANRCYRKSARLGNLDASIRLAGNQAPIPVISDPEHYG